MESTQCTAYQKVQTTPNIKIMKETQDLSSFTSPEPSLECLSPTRWKRGNTILSEENWGLEGPPRPQLTALHPAAQATLIRHRYLIPRKTISSSAQAPNTAITSMEGISAWCGSDKIKISLRYTNMGTPWHLLRTDKVPRSLSVWFKTVAVTQ